MSQNADDPQSLAGEYVLGTLSRVRRREVEQRMSRDAAFAATVQQLEMQLLPLTLLAEPLDPPPALWRRIEHTLFAAQRDPSAPLTRARTWWNSLNIWRGLAAGGFAAAAILLAVLTMQSTPTPAPGLQQRFMVVLSSPDNNTPGWIIEANENRQLRLIPLRAVEVPAARALQFWTKADGWSGPVSLGLVQPGQTINVPLDKLPPLQPNQLFEITLEPQTGSPIGCPTGPVLFIGRAVKVS